MSNGRGVRQAVAYVADKLLVVKDKDLRNLWKNVRMKNGKIALAVESTGDHRRLLELGATLDAEDARRLRGSIHARENPPALRSIRMAEELGLSRSLGH